MQMISQKTYKNLAKYVDYLQSTGHYVFSGTEAKRSFPNISKNAFRLSISRLIRKKRIAKLRRGYYVVIPLEYESAGAPPPSWYIDSLMKYCKLPYYVGLLSAAELYGAAHQHPQTFQVITIKPQRTLTIGNVKINFIVKRKFSADFLAKKMTNTGFMMVSFPELTALDLVQYFKAAGYMNNVVTVLIELIEEMNDKKLIEVATNSPLSVVQRLGYLLEKFTKFNTDPLYQWTKSQDIRFTALRTDKKLTNIKHIKKWKMLNNETIEPDL